MKRAILYGRVSSAAQDSEDRVSLEEQFREMEEYCLERGYEVAARHQDIAPGSTKNRPGFQAVLQDARDGVGDVIVCWKPDRLSRGIYPAAVLMEVIEETGVELESVRDRIDEKTFGIFAAVGKIEIDNFRERATLGKKGAARRGRWPVGVLPYGYRVGADGRPEIDPVEAGFILEIYDRYVNLGQGSKRIADWLSESDAPRRRGSRWGTWFPSAVLGILSHPAYRGQAYYGRRRHRTTESGTRVTPAPKDDWIGVPFPPIVSEELWDAAQDVKRSRSRYSRRNTRAVHLLQGLAYCAECGFRFRMIQNRRNRVRRGGRSYEYRYKKPHRYYKCGGMIDHKTGCREHSHIKADDLEGSVWSEATRILKSPELLTEGLLAGVEGPAIDAAEEEVRNAERDLAGIEAEEDRLLRLYVANKITEPQLDRQRKFITERLEQARATVDGARSRLKAIEMGTKTGDAVAAWADRFRRGLDLLEPAERQELLRQMLQRVVIDRQGNVRMVLAIPVEEFMPVESRES